MTFEERFNFHRANINDIKNEDLDTTEKLLSQLNKIIEIQDYLREKGGSDYETDHYTADELLLKYINDERVTEAFENIKKWYA